MLLGSQGLAIANKGYESLILLSYWIGEILPMPQTQYLQVNGKSVGNQL